MIGKQFYESFGFYLNKGIENQVGVCLFKVASLSSRGKGDHGHLGGFSGLNAGYGVFHYHAVPRSNRELGGGLDKNLRRGFPFINIFAGDIVVKKTVEAEAFADEVKVGFWGG